jgi:hypothetical protein
VRDQFCHSDGVTDTLGTARDPGPGWLHAHPRLLAFAVVALLVGAVTLLSRDLEPADLAGPTLASSGPAALQPLSLDGCGGAPAVLAQDYFANMQNSGSKTVVILSVSSSYPGVRLTGTWQVSDCGADSARPIEGSALSPGAHLFVWLRFRITQCSQAKRVTSFLVTVNYGTTHGEQVQRLSLTTYPLACAT